MLIITSAASETADLSGPLYQIILVPVHWFFILLHIRLKINCGETDGIALYGYTDYHSIFQDEYYGYAGKTIIVIMAKTVAIMTKTI